jgi:group I intron endonuclease
MVDEKSFGIIYKVTNKINGKIYIGQTSQGLESRKYDHENRAIHNSTNMTISKALNKYGFENFIWEILEKCDSKEELDEMEFHYIVSYKSNIRKFGYNNTLGGEGSYGFKHTKEACNKIRKLKTGVKLSDYSINIRSEKQSYVWKIIFPNGKEEEILNLNEFCRKNLLNSGIMNAVSRGDRKHHNGFKCIKLTIKDTKKCSDSTRTLIKNANIGRKLSEESIAKRTAAEAGIWEIYKDNNKLLIKNLKNYCRENSMSYNCMLRVSRGERSQHKGFKCRKLTHEEVYNLRNNGDYK